MSTIKKAGKGSRPVTVMSRALESGDLNESSQWEVSQEEFDGVMALLDEWIEMRESYCEFMGATHLRGKHQKLLKNCRTSFARVKEYRSMIQTRHQIWWGLAMFAMAEAADSSLKLKETLNRFITQPPILATLAKIQKVDDRRDWLAVRIQELEITPEEVKGKTRERLYEQYKEEWDVGKKTFGRDLNRVQALIQRK